MQDFGDQRSLREVVLSAGKIWVSIYCTSSALSIQDHISCLRHGKIKYHLLLPKYSTETLISIEMTWPKGLVKVSFICNYLSTAHRLMERGEAGSKKKASRKGEESLTFSKVSSQLIVRFVLKVPYGYGTQTHAEVHIICFRYGCYFITDTIQYYGSLWDPSWDLGSCI